MIISFLVFVAVFSVIVLVHAKQRGSALDTGQIEQEIEKDVVKVIHWKCRGEVCQIKGSDFII